MEKLAEYTGGRDFSKFGRVNYTLGRRQELLSEVQRLADSLAIGSGDVGYTCEGAAFFHLYHVTRYALGCIYTTCAYFMYCGSTAVHMQRC